MISVVASSTVCSQATEKEAESKPNFVIIFTDDQGYADLGCFGSTKIKTPNIDRMAKEGRKFTSFMVPTSLCTPSRAALLTGCYPKRVGMHHWVLFPYSKEGLNPAEHTIADHLKAQGYSTACFGKWHLGHHPETLPISNGFDTYFGIPYSNDMNHPDNEGKPKGGVEGLDILWSDPESTLTKWKTPLMENDKIIELPVDQRTVTRRYTDKAIDFIKENREKPFFVYLPHTMPHVPLYVPDEVYDPDPQNAHTCVMEHIDAEVGRVMDTIRELKLDKNTYVIFTSDNGPPLGLKHHSGSADPLRGGKTSTFEGGCRVPCVIWGPGRIPAGTECDQLVSTLDILPTIAALTGTELPKGRKIDGLDASVLLKGDNAKSPRDEMLYYDGHGNLEGIRKGKWKLLVKKSQTLLFDLLQDVGEQDNLADANPDVVKELTARMKSLGDEVEKNSRAPWVLPAERVDQGKPPSDNRPSPIRDLTYKYYEGDWNKLPDFSKLKPNSNGLVASNRFDLSLAERPDYFGLVFEGTLIVPEDGIYTFTLHSDDGAALYVGNDFKLDNDGLHGLDDGVIASVALKKGPHPVRLTYFEKAVDEGLICTWSGPGIKKQFLSAKGGKMLELNLRVNTLPRPNSTDPEGCAPSLERLRITGEEE